MGFLHRPVSFAVVLSVFLSSLAILVPSMTRVAEAAPKTKVKYEVCHRTNAIKNPYRRISVAWSAVDDNGNGHDNPVHDGPVFNVATPQATHGTTPRDSGLGSEAGGGNDRWGDIFYAIRQTGNQWNANNWFVNDSDRNSGANTAGQAIFAGTAINTLTGKPACKAMSVKEFIESEREANPNVLMDDLMDELDEMNAAEDLPLKTVLGGSFSTWHDSCTVNCEDISVVTGAIDEKLPNVTTTPPTNILGTSASLNGTVAPLGTSMQWFFEYVATTSNFADDNPNIDITTPVAANASTTSSPPQSVTANITGLTSGTIYYYRTVGLVTSGSNDTEVESYTYGVVKQFTFGAPGSPTITGITCGSTTLSIAFNAPTVNAGSIDAYEFSVDGGATFTNRAGTVSPIAVTGLVNGTQYSVAIRARAGSVVGVDSVAMNATPCGTPVAVTDLPTPITQPSTTLRGNLSANGNPLTVTFVWGTDPNLSSNNTTSNASPNTLPGTATQYPVTFNAINLTIGTTYYYKVVGTQANNSTVEGSIQQFVITAQPDVTTEPATSITGTTATINGTGTSNGAVSTVTFTWGTSSGLTVSNNTVTVSPTLGTTASGAGVTGALTGLTPGTTYYFRATITNVNGTADGVILQFTTETPQAPTVAPTTTLAPATTVAPVGPASVATGTASGSVWIDSDLDERKDSNESWLPGIVVSLTLQSDNTQTVSLTTDANGSVSFTSVAPGAYSLRAILPNDVGLDRSWDTTRNTDWIVPVTVEAGKNSSGEFAAVGSALATGTVTGGGGGELTVVWSGIDQKLDTDDDTTLVANISDSDEFVVSGLPTGRFTVSATSRTGRRLVSAASLRITDAGATVNSGPLKMNVRIVRSLPQTGGSGLLLPFGFAAMLLPVGIASTALARRRRR